MSKLDLTGIRLLNSLYLKDWRVEVYTHVSFGRVF